MSQENYIEHRRADGERVGWLRQIGDEFQAIDLLGREQGGLVDWLTGEELLEKLGLRYLADPYLLRLADDTYLRVRIVEVSTDRIVVKRDDFGAVDGPIEIFELTWPIPVELVPAGDNQRTGW